MVWLAPAVVAVGAIALLLLGRWLAGITQGHPDPVVALHLRYQPLALAVAISAVVLVRMLVPAHADYFAVGDWSAPASGLGWLGVSDGDSWSGVGLTFLVVMTLVTTVVMWVQVGRRSSLRAAILVRALGWAVAFSVVNALTEELLFRLTLADALGPVIGATAVALWSAALFGVPHYFGHPGRVPGVLLAGFLGWFLQLSVLQTGGLGWAVTLHFAQDVVILTILVAAQRPAVDRTRSSSAAPRS